MDADRSAGAAPRAAEGRLCHDPVPALRRRFRTGRSRQAAESYKREAAIVDPRLSHEVTCAFKGTALSDLCEQLRADTGIQLTAGPSVADEKVTLFCEKLPLARGDAAALPAVRLHLAAQWQQGGEYRYELVQDLRTQLLEEELRNRDRNAALLALDREIERYRRT